MNILGISAYYHDAAAALLQDGKVVAAAQEERFSRKKNDPSFPAQAIAWCLDFAGLDLADLDAIAFYDKPLLKFERLLETYYNVAPRGLTSFLRAIPIWAREKVFLKTLLRKELKKQTAHRHVPPILFPRHHLSHAASAFFPSPFACSAILTIDGVGEWATATIGRGDGRKIRLLRELHFPHSLGLLYSSFTYFLGFRVNAGEYKMMGLAPYADPEAAPVRHYQALIEDRLVRIREDGSIWMDQRFFRYMTGLRMIHEKRWEKLFGFPRRMPDQPLEPRHAELALAIQRVTEKVVLRMAAEAHRLTGLPDLCLAGGVALNSVANGKLLRQGPFQRIFIQPAAGDAGGSLGAALAAHHLYFAGEREPATDPDGMNGAYLGPCFSQLDIERTIRAHGAVGTLVPDEEVLVHRVAQLLAEGKVVGWFQGRMEFGPRALGNRSILADPRDPDMQRTLNRKIKFRESFRPFAPAVMEEEAAAYFELEASSPYMLLVAPVRADRRKPLPANYQQLSFAAKRDLPRSDIPAVTHIDFSARVQTVRRATNKRFHRLLRAFQSQTGCSVLINTSFNVRDEPIVCSPEDAYRCFLRTDMDVLVMENYLFFKKDQPAD